MKSFTTILLVLWSLTMAGLLFTPGSPDISSQYFEGQDKVAHFGLFMGWSFLMTLRSLYSMSAKVVILFVIGVSVVLGAGTEIIQGIIPNRSKDFFDFLADMCGAGIGVSTAFLFKWLLKRE